MQQKREGKTIMEIRKITGVVPADKRAVEAAFDSIEPQPVACCNWPEQYPYAPEVSFRMFHTGAYLMLRFDVAERWTMARVTEDNGEVWTDSCVEFFIAPDDSGYYYNFECTCIGRLLVGFRREREHATHATPRVMESILRENIHIPDGTVPEARISEYCASYDHSVRKIDLMIIGVGEDGQIGFNEPGSYAKSRTRLVQLTHNTRKIQSGAFFGLENTPKMAITMGIDTIMRAEKIILMAWGEEKAKIVQKVVEGEVTSQVPASNLQMHPNIEVVIDENAAQMLTREQTPWLVGPCKWTPKFTRKAVVWLCGVVQKPILKLTYKDYIENSLGELLEQGRAYDQINIDVFNDLQHTITGWPGGKPNADDSTRPVSSEPFPKRVVVFSPHPDDDVISMGGTFIRLVQQGHDVHVAYETSGNVAVHDDVVLQNIDTARELGFGDHYAEVEKIIAGKKKGEPEPRPLLDLKGAIRRAEARAAVRSFGLNPDTNAHFLNLPFYETGGIKKGQLTEKDIDIIVKLLREVKPHQIYAAGDLADPHGTHRTAMEAVLGALDVVRDDEWLKECHLWLYRGAWMEWDLGMVDMAVPLSPDELIMKRHAIYRHLSQKDIMPFPGSDPREFWQRAEERTQNTAQLYDKLGMAEYQAIEVFVKMF